MSHEVPGIGPGLSSKVNDVVSNDKTANPLYEALKFMGRKQTVQVRILPTPLPSGIPAHWCLEPHHLPSAEGLDSLCSACLYPAEG